MLSRSAISRLRIWCCISGACAPLPKRCLLPYHGLNAVQERGKAIFGAEHNFGKIIEVAVKNLDDGNVRDSHTTGRVIAIPFRLHDLGGLRTGSKPSKAGAADVRAD
jgi:hypothetical protein